MKKRYFDLPVGLTDQRLGISPPNHHNTQYTYDKNGNLTKDLNKNILSIQYNFLNLPANITYSKARENEVRSEMLHFTVGQFNSDAFDTFTTSGFQRITDLLNGEK